MPVLGLTLAIRKDALGTLRRWRARVRRHRPPAGGLQERILLNHPDYIEQVLVIQQSKFHKSELTKTDHRADARAGAADQRRRILAAAAAAGAAGVSSQPHQRICRHDGGKRPALTSANGATAKSATSRSEMMALTLDIAVRTLFGTTLPGEAQQVGHAMTFLMRYRSPPAVALPDSRKLAHAAQTGARIASSTFIDSLVYRIIEERQAQRQLQSP